MIGFADDTKADGGYFTTRETRIYESEQNAIIAFNGGIERLYLSVNIKADSDTDGFHVIPFPSMPKVSLGNISIFTNLSHWESRNYGKNDLYFTGGDGGDDGSIHRNSSVSLLLNERIGDHNVTVIRIDENTSFQAELRTIASYLGMNLSVWKKGYDDVIGDYAKRGIRYFTIDRYPIYKEERTLEPLVFEFNSDKVFFPLEISSILKGGSYISIDIISSDPIPLETPMDHKVHFDGPMSIEDLDAVDPTLKEFLGGPARLISFSFNADLPSLKGDLELKVEDTLIARRSIPNYDPQETETFVLENEKVLIFHRYNMIDAYSIPDLRPLWRTDSGNRSCELAWAELGLKTVLLSEEYDHRSNGSTIQRIDPRTGDPMWTKYFKGYIVLRMWDREQGFLTLKNQENPVIVLDTQSGELFLDPSDGSVTDSVLFSESLSYYVIDHEGSELIAIFNGTGACLYSMDRITYFDPRDGMVHRNVSGKIPLNSGASLEITPGIRRNLSEVLDLDAYLMDINLSKFMSPYLFNGRTIHNRTWVDPDIGIVVEQYIQDRKGSGGMIYCYDRTGAELKWSMNVSIAHGTYVFFADLNEDGDHEMIMFQGDYGYMFMDSCSTNCLGQSLIVRDGNGALLLYKKDFKLLPGFRQHNGQCLMAGFTMGMFGCYDMLDGTLLYGYPIVQSPDSFVWAVVSSWNETEANICLLDWRSYYDVRLMRSDPTSGSFKTITSRYGMGSYLIDMGPSYCGILVGSALYSFSYDDIRVHRDYPNIFVPEEKMGIERLMPNIRPSGDEGQYIDDDPEEKDVISIPFIGTVPIVLIAILMVLIEGRRRH